MMMHGLRCMGSEWAQVRAGEPSLFLTELNTFLPMLLLNRPA